MPLFDIPIQVLMGQLMLGLINGSFYAVLSLGLAIIFGLLNIINFTHGAQFMMGAFVAWMLLSLGSAEAARIGLVLMAMAGYDPREAVGLWERMRAANSGKQQAEWLSTHPADTTRISDIKRWLPEAMKYYRAR